MVHPPNTCNSQGEAKLSWNSTCAFYLRGRDRSTWSCLSPAKSHQMEDLFLHLQEARAETELGLQLEGRSYETGIQAMAQLLCHMEVPEKEIHM